MSSDDPTTRTRQTGAGPTQMSVEVAQQPEAVARTLAHLRPARADLARLAQGRRRVSLVARGSSDNAAVYGRYLLETHSRWSAALAAPSVATLYQADLDLSDAIVVSVSQSGATEEIVDAQDWAKRHGAATVAVTNDGDSPLASAADVALVTQAGVERAVPATKTYTTQLTAMAVLASALSGDQEVLDGALDRVPDEIAGLIDRRSGIDEAVDRLAQAAEVMVSGRGLVFGTALEIALKLEETCLRPVRGLSYADLRHGPMAVVDAELVAVLVAAADGPVLPGMHDLADDIAGRGAVTIGIGGDARFGAKCEVAVAGPDLPETVAPLALVVPGQLIVEQLALRLGLDPDAPRGLNKITQTD
jgi:glucosamine--fructose-6-phosphate aminotransferase (isomerizing)